MDANNRYRARAPLVVLAASFIVGACDACDEPATEAASTVVVADSVELAADSARIKACDVTTEAELESVLGTDLEGARTTSDYGGVTQCRWNLPGDAQRGVSISLHEHGDIENYRKLPGSAPVSGLGDGAVWNQEYSQLAVRDGERVFSIALFVEDAQRAHAEEIARAALERMTTGPTPRPAATP